MNAAAGWAPFFHTGESVGTGWSCALLLRYGHKPWYIVFPWICSNFPSNFSLKCKFLCSNLYSSLFLISSLIFLQGDSLYLHLPSLWGTSCCEGMRHWCVLWQLKGLHREPGEAQDSLYTATHLVLPWSALPYGWLRVEEHWARLWHLHYWKYSKSSRMRLWTTRCGYEVVPALSRRLFQMPPEDSSLFLSLCSFLSSSVPLSCSLFFFLSVSFFSMETETGTFPPDTEKNN